ncbi:MAG: thermonuclease family protein [Anaerolineae bacterium]
MATNRTSTQGSIGIGCRVLAILLLACSGCASSISEQADTDHGIVERITVVVEATPELAAPSTSTPTAKPSNTPSHTPNPTWTPTQSATPTPEFTPTLQRTEATVVEVVDGDTIRVRIAGEVHPLRYIGIDTPELDEPMGAECCSANERLVGDKTVYLEKDVSETDQYGRLLRYVYLANGVFVNAELVRRGYARPVAYRPDVSRQELLADREQQAGAAQVGIWAPTPTDVPPTSTPIPLTPAPASATPLPPSATAVPASPTPVPPT